MNAQSYLQAFKQPARVHLGEFPVDPPASTLPRSVDLALIALQENAFSIRTIQRLLTLADEDAISLGEVGALLAQPSELLIAAMRDVVNALLLAHQVRPPD